MRHYCATSEFGFRQKLQMWSELTRLIGKSYSRAFQYIFFGFVQPIFFFAIFYFIFTLKFTQQYGAHPETLIAGYILLAPITSSLISFANMLSEWKSSVLLKRLDVTPITKVAFMAILTLFFLVVSFIAAFWMMVWAVIFLAAEGKDIHAVFGQLNWGWFILTIIQLIFICNALAILIAGISKGRANTQGYIMAIYFPCSFLGGVLLPMATVDQVEALRWISYFLPLKYPAMLSMIAWHGTSAIQQFYYDVGSQTLKQWSEFPNTWIPAVVGFVYAGIFFGVSFKTFKWTVRD